MASLMESVLGSLGGDSLNQISQYVGADRNTTSSAITAALPMLLGALARNTSSEDGAGALSSALSKDHDGSILDNLGSFLQNPASGPGDGILGHVLGDRRSAVENGLSKSTGMDAASVGKLLTTLAPVVLGALGKTQRENSLDPGALAGILSGETADLQKQAPKEMGFLGKLLDADNDGDVDMGDIAKQGFNIFGKLLGGR